MHDAAAEFDPDSADRQSPARPRAELSDPDVALGEKNRTSTDSGPAIAAASSKAVPTRTAAHPAAQRSESDAPSTTPPMPSVASEGRPDRLPVTQAQADTAVDRAAPPRRRGFGTGFAIGLLIAAILAGLYAAAPLAGDGWLGDALQGLRGIGDEFHQWVQDHLAGLR